VERQSKTNEMNKLEYMERVRGSEIEGCYG
jgi:hypothetical protein